MRVLYTSPFQVDQSTTVQAYAIQEDSKFEKSDLAMASYDCAPKELRVVLNVPNNPVTCAEAGGALVDGDYTPVTPLEPISVLLDTGIDFGVQLDFGGTPMQFDYQFDLLTTA